MENKKRLHPAWVVMVGCCFLLMALALITTCMSFFVEPVSEDLGFERSAFTVYYSIAALIGVIAMPIWGRIIPKLGIKLSVVIAGTGGAVFMALFSLCRSLVSFYACGLLMGIMIAGMTTLPASILINTWFQARRGLAMGIVMASSGIGGAIFSPILAEVIKNYGWQYGYVANGVAMALLTVPSALILLKERPTDFGLLPYGATESAGDAGIDAGQTIGISAKVALKSSPFILLALAVVLLNVMASLTQHLPAHFVDSGIGATTAAAIVSIYMLAVIGAKIFLGIVNDRFGIVSAIVGSFALWAVSFMALAITHSVSVAVIGAILFGFGVSVVTVIPPLLTAHMFGQKDYSAIYAVIGALSSLGLAIGTPIVGLVYDKTGSYVMAFYGCLLVLAVTLVAILAALSSAKRLPKDTAASDGGA